jgi:F0F1-type ATP synthase membrane subunit c/vacuolar-type H+-ATPase subunit K
VIEPSNPEDDPGWPRSPSALLFLVPGLMQRRLRRSRLDGLTLLRQVVLSFSATLVLFGVVLAFMPAPRGRAVPLLALLAILAVVAIATTLLGNVMGRPPDCSSPRALAGNYRTRFFVKLAFADSVGLLGFVLALRAGPRLIYYLAAAFTLVRIWTGIAPTRSALAREQEALHAQGCGLSLIAALRTTTPPTATTDP